MDFDQYTKVLFSFEQLKYERKYDSECNADELVL